MAEGFMAAVANAILDDKLAAYPWIKKHVGPPGAAGTANPAADTTRKQGAFTAASGGAATNSADIVWPDVTAAEDYTHVTGWSAVTGGTVGWSGTCTANAVQVDDDFTLRAGQIAVSIPVAS